MPLEEPTLMAPLLSKPFWTRSPVAEGDPSAPAGQAFTKSASNLRALITESFNPAVPANGSAGKRKAGTSTAPLPSKAKDKKLEE
ncbi:hypothetical protein TrCOL_g374 [Triparma columacea]|uniref:Uncharacterized protein n=1 Tax=Triparma columacea TaxID=722753 RepID=A0A9W7GIT9_9STRA|nr:hypothetical protein TrCOL_g374 [Triparma columacea]